MRQYNIIWMAEKDCKSSGNERERERELLRRFLRQMTVKRLFELIWPL